MFLKNTVCHKSTTGCYCLDLFVNLPLLATVRKASQNLLRHFGSLRFCLFISLLHEQSISGNTCNLETFGSTMSTMLKKKKKKRNCLQTQHKTCFCFAECADRRIWCFRFYVLDIKHGKQRYRWEKLWVCVGEYIDVYIHTYLSFPHCKSQNGSLWLPFKGKWRNWRASYTSLRFTFSC